MKPVPYSPFNRTYKFMCLQNQLAHHKNKQQVKGLVDHNLALVPGVDSTRRSSQGFNRSAFSTQSLSESVQGRLKAEPLTIHKNSKYNARQEQERRQENSRINRKLS